MGNENWNRTPAEWGRINGIPFIRASWSGNESFTGNVVYGIVYMGVDGLDTIDIEARDIGPPKGRTYKLIEAAVLTFRKGSSH